MDEYTCINENLIAEIEYSKYLQHIFNAGYDSGSHFFKMFCFMSSFLCLTTFVSTYIVAHYVWKPMDQKSKEVDWPFEHDPEFIPYEKKYPLSDDDKEEQEDLDNKKDDDLEKRRKDSNCFVAENTPSGYVIMTYDTSYESFTYWAKTKNIPYKYLETVARKYVKTLDDTNLYVSREKDIANQIKAEEMKQKNMNESLKNDKKSEDNNDVFVKLKSPIEKQVLKNKNINFAINGNKYKWMGKIDFNVIFKPPEDEKKEENLSFSSFKKLFG